MLAMVVERMAVHIYQRYNSMVQLPQQLHVSNGKKHIRAELQMCCVINGKNARLMPQTNGLVIFPQLSIHACRQGHVNQIGSQAASQDKKRSGTTEAHGARRCVQGLWAEMWCGPGWPLG